MKKINQTTHNKINSSLCGNSLILKENYSRIELLTTGEMIVDETGLIHGGFVFGLADYAAMVCINHPNVVLGAADVKFVKPVKKGDTLIAEAYLEKIEGKKYRVKVEVKEREDLVFHGIFTCFIPDKHVLKKPLINRQDNRNTRS